MKTFLINYTIKSLDLVGNVTYIQANTPAQATAKFRIKYGKDYKINKCINTATNRIYDAFGNIE